MSILGTWVCPVCSALVRSDQARRHQRSHVTEVTMARYQKSFPRMSEDLLCGMAFLHLLTEQHATGRCCQPENGRGPRPT